jgi:hydroxymethylbilane synthase
MVSDRATQLAWEAERCVIEKLGADCGSCVAVYANLNANQVRLRAQVFSADGRSLIEDEGVAPAKDVRNLGLGIGDSLLRAGAADLL